MTEIKSIEQNESNDDRIEPEAIDYSIMKEIIQNPTITDQALGEKFDLSRQTVNRRRNSIIVKKLIKDALSIQEQNLRDVFARSLLKLTELMNHSDTKISLEAAKHVSAIGKGFFEGVGRKKSPFDDFVP